MSLTFQTNSWICLTAISFTVASYILTEILIHRKSTGTLEKDSFSGSMEILGGSQDLKQGNAADSILLGEDLMKKRRDMALEQEVYNSVFPFYLGAISLTFFLFTALNIN